MTLVSQHTAIRKGVLLANDGLALPQGVYELGTGFLASVLKEPAR